MKAYSLEHQRIVTVKQLRSGYREVVSPKTATRDGKTFVIVRGTIRPKWVASYDKTTMVPIKPPKPRPIPKGFWGSLKTPKPFQTANIKPSAEKMRSWLEQVNTPTVVENSDKSVTGSIDVDEEVLLQVGQDWYEQVLPNQAMVVRVLFDAKLPAHYHNIQQRETLIASGWMNVTFPQFRAVCRRIRENLESKDIEVGTHITIVVHWAKGRLR